MSLPSNNFLSKPGVVISFTTIFLDISEFTETKEVDFKLEQLGQVILHYYENNVS